MIDIFFILLKPAVLITMVLLFLKEVVGVKTTYAVVTLPVWMLMLLCVTGCFADWVDTLGLSGCMAIMRW